MAFSGIGRVIFVFELVEIMMASSNSVCAYCQSYHEIQLILKRYRLLAYFYLQGLRHNNLAMRTGISWTLIFSEKWRSSTRIKEWFQYVEYLRHADDIMEEGKKHAVLLSPVVNQTVKKSCVSCQAGRVKLPSVTILTSPLFGTPVQHILG